MLNIAKQSVKLRRSLFNPRVTQLMPLISLDIQETTAMPPKKTQKKHEALPFRKIMILAIERTGRETNRFRRGSTRYENMRQFVEESGINRTVVPNVRDGNTKTPTRETFQKMAAWLQSLSNPLTDENNIPIVYSWVELQLLDEAAQEQGMDENDPYIVQYEKDVTPDKRKKNKNKSSSQGVAQPELDLDIDPEDEDALAAALTVLTSLLTKKKSGKKR